MRLRATLRHCLLRCSLMTIVIVFFSFETFAIRPCVTTRRLAIFSAASALSSHSFLLIELILIYKHISSSVLVVVLLRIPLLCNKSSLYLSSAQQRRQVSFWSCRARRRFTYTLRSGFSKKGPESSSNPTGFPSTCYDRRQFRCKLRLSNQNPGFFRANNRHNEKVLLCDLARARPPSSSALPQACSDLFRTTSVIPTRSR